VATATEKLLLQQIQNTICGCLSPTFFREKKIGNNILTDDVVERRMVGAGQEVGKEIDHDQTPFLRLWGKSERFRSVAAILVKERNGTSQ